MSRRRAMSSVREVSGGGAASSLYIEAESGVLGANWGIVADANASGGSAIVNSFIINHEYNYTRNNPDDYADYTFNTQSGLYSIYFRSRKVKSADDTVWVRHNDVEYNCRTSDTTQYSWWQLNTGFNILNTQQINLVEGENSIRVILREELYLDRIYITKNGDSPI